MVTPKSPVGSDTMGDRLRAVRVKAGKSQENMAALLDINLSTYRAFERGAREVNAAAIFRLFDTFGVDPTWLYTGKGLGIQATHRGGEVAMWKDSIEWVANQWADKDIRISEVRRARLYEALVNHLKGGGKLADDVALVYLEMAQ